MVDKRRAEKIERDEQRFTIAVKIDNLIIIF